MKGRLFLPFSKELLDSLSYGNTQPKEVILLPVTDLNDLESNEPGVDCYAYLKSLGPQRNNAFCP